MTDVRQVCDGKSVGDSTVYLRKVGQFLENLVSLIDENDVCTTIWNPPPKQLLIAQQSYVEYKFKSFQQIDVTKNYTVIQTVINLIVVEQISILQTAPSKVTQPVFQRSESATDDITNKKAKWW